MFVVSRQRASILIPNTKQVTCLVARRDASRARSGGVRRPVEDGVGGVVEHLADDFPAGAGIAASLDFDQGGDAVLIQEEVVQGPAGAALLLVRDAYFAGDQEPAARRARVDLVPRQQVGVAGEELLEIQFCAIYRKETGGFRHLR